MKVYRTKVASEGNLGELESWMNELGKGGWGLHTFALVDSNGDLVYTAVMEREVRV